MKSSVGSMGSGKTWRGHMAWCSSLTTCCHIAASSPGCSALCQQVLEDKETERVLALEAVTVQLMCPWVKWLKNHAHLVLGAHCMPDHLLLGSEMCECTHVPPRLSPPRCPPEGMSSTFSSLYYPHQAPCLGHHGLSQCRVNRWRNGSRELSGSLGSFRRSRGWWHLWDMVACMHHTGCQHSHMSP